MRTKNILIAAATFACAAALSVSWSEQGGVSLSIGSAKAAQKTSHMHRYSRGHMARASRAYGRGPGPVEAGADMAAGVVNTAGAIAFGALDTAGAIAAAPFGGPVGTTAITRRAHGGTTSAAWALQDAARTRRGGLSRVPLTTEAVGASLVPAEEV